MAAFDPPRALFCGSTDTEPTRTHVRPAATPQLQCKLGEVDADGNWQLGSPASATDDKTQTVSVTGHKRRAPKAPAAPFTAGNLKAAVHHNAAKEKKEPVGSKPVGQGEQSVSNAEEQPAAAKPNENPATPVQHVPLASIKSESPPGSNGADKNPIDLTGTVRGTGRNRPKNHVLAHGHE